MKRIFSLLFVLAVVVTTTSNVHAQSSTVHAQCSDATLRGHYGLKGQGFGSSDLKPGNQRPFAIVGVVTFDGAGNASFTVTSAFNGGGGELFEAVPGTYTVNPDCTGSVTIEDFDLHYYIVTVGGGAEFFAIQTDIGATTTIEGKKQ